MIFNGKEIYIWGARWRGKQICDFLKDKHSLSIKAFIDSDTKLIGSSYCGVEVIAPKYFFDEYNSVDTIIIIACFNAVYEEEIVKEIGKNHFRGETVLQGDSGIMKFQIHREFIGIII